MTQTRNTPTKQTPHEVGNTPRPFSIADDCHLLVATSGRVCAWDHTGVETIFSSSKRGIVAATEAHDGSGMLAVADKHVVVLHDTKRGQEKSWGLEAGEDQVRHLEYTTSAGSLFLSTNLTPDIQQYSTSQARLLSPTRSHISSPIAIAISPNEHWMVSASDGPPIVYLRELKKSTTPVLIEPQASKAAVSVAAFHPNQPNLFLLAFRDGIAAAYDAAKILRSGAGSVPSQETVNRGELSHVPGLHRSSNASTKGPITGAAFLPGFKTRAVTVGRDGKCRLIDFAEGGKILRTWHAGAPVASVSILSSKSVGKGRNVSSMRTTTSAAIATAAPDSLLAVAREDGQIHMYDSLGLLLSQHNIGVPGEKLLSVEWVDGPSPKPIACSQALDIASLPMDASVSSKRTGQVRRSSTSPRSISNPAARSRRNTMFNLTPELPALKETSGTVAGAEPHRMFTIHPDEVQDGTVRRIPRVASSDGIIVPKGDYLDLFSPVKGLEPRTASQKSVTRPLSPRPIVTSQTFLKSPEAMPVDQHDDMVKRRNLELFPSTDSGARPSRAQTSAAILEAPSPGNNSPFKKRITYRASSVQQKRRKSGFHKTDPRPPNSNAKVLAELRKMSVKDDGGRPGGTLSVFASSRPGHSPSKMVSTLQRKENTFRLFKRATDHIETELDSENARKAYEDLHKKRFWPEDSNQESSLDYDIWLTSDSDHDGGQQEKRKRLTLARPPARQTSRSRVTSKGTTSTTAQGPTNTTAPTVQPPQRMDGSTEEDMFTAETHITSNGTLSPSSQDVRQLFPRSSSLSPRRRHKSTKHKQRVVQTESQPLAEITPNRVADRQIRSPWARARADKAGQGLRKERNGKPVAVLVDPAPTILGQQKSRADVHCGICSPTRARVAELDAEVARLKGEVVLFKTILRRQGVPIPRSARENQYVYT